MQAQQGFFVDWNGDTRRLDMPGDGYRCEVVACRTYQRVDVIAEDGEVIHEAVYYETREALLAAGVEIVMALPWSASEVVVRAYRFADAAHAAIGQKRKYTGEDYIVHPLEVAQILRTVSHTDAMLAAALLHDTEEDTEVSHEEIVREFGTEIAELVGWLTDVSRKEDGNRKVRKAIDRGHVANAPGDAQTIKLADVISNSRSILTHDRKFARVYLPEMAELLCVLSKGDRDLWTRAGKQVREGLAGLERQ